jgi:hypothetical protein
LVLFAIAVVVPALTPVPAFTTNDNTDNIKHNDKNDDNTNTNNDKNDDNTNTNNDKNDDNTNTNNDNDDDNTNNNIKHNDKNDGNKTRLGNPFLVEQGRIGGERVVAVTPQPQVESTFVADATINSDGDAVINAINTGTSVTTLNADGTFSGQGQGILRSQGGDVVIWTNQWAGNVTAEGTIITRGAGFWSTFSTTTGELAFMNGMVTVFEVQIDGQGNLSAREWEWG